MKYHQLISAQRCTISVLLKKKMSVKGIADTINVHYSTVFHELKRSTISIMALPKSCVTSASDGYASTVGSVSECERKSSHYWSMSSG